MRNYLFAFSVLAAVLHTEMTVAYILPKQRTGKSTPARIPKNACSDTAVSVLSRRSVLAFVSSGVLLGPSQTATAFPNKISDKYDDRPKRRGPQPKDLGVAKRQDMVGEEYLGLKPCKPSPNCFCSTDIEEDDPDHYIPPWIWPSKLTMEEAFKQLEQVISAYKPGQNNVDGGGFQIVQSDAKRGYIYTQFEALKNGYIDDVELAYIKGRGDRAVQVRSSSRIGYLDYGVNAKRLNYIANSLRDLGWEAVGVDYATHRNYVIQNELE